MLGNGNLHCLNHVKTMIGFLVQVNMNRVPILIF
jgi:hypothetical protein